MFVKLVMLVNLEHNLRRRKLCSFSFYLSLVNSFQKFIFELLAVATSGFFFQGYFRLIHPRVSLDERLERTAFVTAGKALFKMQRSSCGSKTIYQ